MDRLKKPTKGKIWAGEPVSELKNKTGTWYSIRRRATHFTFTLGLSLHEARFWQSATHEVIWTHNTDAQYQTFHNLVQD
jgi:hypothetical protein